MQLRNLLDCLKQRGKARPRNVVTSDDESLFPSWPPPNPSELLSQRALQRDRLSRRKYRAPRKVFEDSPLFGLYRLYEWILVDHPINLRNELECFWWARWPVAAIPDPGEQGDPERYAVLACIPALVVESFNERVRLGLRREEPHSILPLEEQLRWAATPEVFESVPEWTKGVRPLATTLHIPHSQPGLPQLTSLDDPQACLAFREKNILMAQPHIHFI
ncbi:hypothetical protein CONLIGDRAFT_259294 [Coniochaeta ligniaria NRRL 30616]|uniref:Uncharacterized protein n=1 Tax=Coniochaeta ligniaria NRRL 30616 TaxID=1408157 RepID=A0A1J7JQG1_9PEZI|nr:hypothetical protein CONLIGDRAFT_259294 [Coniochaeta ligniaria NRRL 30616]